MALLRMYELITTWLSTHECHTLWQIPYTASQEISDVSVCLPAENQPRNSRTFIFHKSDKFNNVWVSSSLVIRSSLAKACTTIRPLSNPQGVYKEGVPEDVSYPTGGECESFLRQQGLVHFRRERKFSARHPPRLPEPGGLPQWVGRRPSHQP